MCLESSSRKRRKKKTIQSHIEHKSRSRRLAVVSPYYQEITTHQTQSAERNANENAFTQQNSNEPVELRVSQESNTAPVSHHSKVQHASNVAGQESNGSDIVTTSQVPRVPNVAEAETSNASNADHASQALHACSVAFHGKANSPVVAHLTQVPHASTVAAVQNSEVTPNVDSALNVSGTVQEPDGSPIRANTATLIDGLADRFRDYFQEEVRRFLNDGWADRPRNTQILERFCQNCDSMQSFEVRPRFNTKSTAGIKKPDRHEK